MLIPGQNQEAEINNRQHKQTMRKILLLLLQVWVISMQGQDDPHLDSLSRNAWYLHDRDDPNARVQAQLLARQVLSLDGSKQNKIALARAYSTLAHMELLDRRFKKAQSLYDSCMFYRQQSGDLLGIAAVEINLSVLKQQTGYYPEALQHAQLAERIVQDEIRKKKPEQERATSLLSMTYTQISNVYSDQDFLEEAKTFARNAFELIEGSPRKDVIAIAAHNLANRYFDANNQVEEPRKSIYRDSARTLYLVSADLYNSEEDSLSVADVYNSLSSLYIAESKYDSAGLYLDLAKSYLVVDDSSRLFYIWKNKGWMLQLQGKHKDALGFLEKAATVEKEDPDSYIDLYSKMVESYKALDESQKAINYLEKIAELKKKLYESKQHEFNESVKKPLLDDYKLAQKNLDWERQKVLNEKNKASIFILMAVVLALVLFSLWLSYRNVQRKTREQNLKIQSLIQSADKNYVDGIEEKMKNLSSDLHAELGVGVVSLKAVSNSLITNLEAYPLEKEEALALRSQIEQIFGSLRDRVHAVGSTLLEKSNLVVSINEMINQLRIKRGITINFVSDTGRAEISSDIELNLYRIVQNLMSNSILHGNPSEIKLTLTSDNDQLRFDYSDNGKGFDTQMVRYGAGISDIEKRANAVQATGFDLATAPGRGFSLHFDVPLKPSLN